MGSWIKINSLITTLYINIHHQKKLFLKWILFHINISASHVSLSSINIHVLINQGDHLLLITQIIVCDNLPSAMPQSHPLRSELVSPYSSWLFPPHPYNYLHTRVVYSNSTAFLFHQFFDETHRNLVNFFLFVEKFKIIYH